MLMNNQKEEKNQGIGFLSVLKSTLFAACGVQTKANRERDFEQGKPSTFVVAGIVFVIFFSMKIVM